MIIEFTDKEVKILQEILINLDLDRFDFNDDEVNTFDHIYKKNSKIMNFEAKTHPKIVSCIETQLIDVRYGLPFYGQFNLNMNFFEKKEIPTCGVNVSRKGFNFYYNTEFLNKLPQLEVNFVDIHELFHLLFNHPQRTVVGNYDPYLANVVQDMIINYIIWTEIDHNHVQIPKYFKKEDENGEIENADEIGKHMALFVPKEYDGPLIFEALYSWLNQKKQERKQPQQGKSGNEGQDGNKSPEGSKGGKDKDENGKPSGGKGNYGPFGKGDIDTYSLDDVLDNLEKKKGCWMDVHIGDDCPGGLRDAMVKELSDRIKARGFGSGKLEKILEKLQKKRKDYLSEIKRSISNDIVGRNKKETIVRPSRRGIVGLKGNKKVQNVINCILDTSGSMNGTFSKVLSYIYRNDIQINLIQCDANVQKAEVVRNMNQLQKVKIKGLGGTVLMPGVDFISENYNKYNTVILTDGICDKLDFKDIKGKVLIISCDRKCQVINDNGRVKQIVIDKHE